MNHFSKIAGLSLLAMGLLAGCADQTEPLPSPPEVIDTSTTTPITNPSAIINPVVSSD